ncbi:putative sperm-associated antigen 16 protein-like [Scophthalmus maximus]|uniref:Putative sperm-associated antigen 16 protein-like n=1 Tax=Scophthalmus maximus TaxID=52904 RepID=A0A2U9CVP1_SCOMX|nr:putative sperm-associated antigen 16 protein-like [Scophthalmus maximus]
MSTNKNREQEDASAPSDSDDECKDEEVSPEDDWSLTEGEGDLEATLRALQTRTEATSRPTATGGARRPEAVDDFLRNFLLQTGMTRTLDCFQTEWAEMVQGELVDAAEVGVVPDVYTDNQRLDTELKSAQREREDYRLAASAAAPALVKVQRARDLHRLQHKRVVQERTRLTEEMGRLQPRPGRGGKGGKGGSAASSEI